MLDIFIGLTLAYLLFSLLASTIFEMVGSLIGLRGRFLLKDLARILQVVGSENIRSRFFDHPVFKSLYQGKWGKKLKPPSYISSRTFSDIILQLMKDDERRGTLANFQSQLPAAMQQIWDKSAGNVQAFKLELEQWFDEVMDRATGWYKGYSQLWMLFIGLVLAISFNADTFQMYSHLKNNPKDAAALADLATDMMEDEGKNVKDSTSMKVAKYAAYYNKLDSVERQQLLHPDSILPLANTAKLLTVQLESMQNPLGIGWPDKTSKEYQNWKWHLCHILGWLVTAIAISLSAAFWFDLLKKLVNIRIAGKAPEPSNGAAPASNATTPPSAVAATSSNPYPAAVG